MTQQLITVDVSRVHKYSKQQLRRLRGVIAGARRNLINNMAFSVRNLAIKWGIPRVMTVRNPGIIRSTLKVTKATRAKEVATLGMEGKGGTWKALRAQEFGGRMGQQPATKAARGGSPKKKIAGKFRLRGDFITPDDIDVAHEKNEAHRIHVFLERLQRPGGIDGSTYYNKPFVLNPGKGYAPGLFKLGKKLSQSTLKDKYRRRTGITGRKRVKRSDIKSQLNSRQLVTLRRFNKKSTHVRRTKWMRPSIDQYFRTHSLKAEWTKAVRQARKYQK